MVDANNATELSQATNESHNEGREDYDMDVDRMVNEGLGGGNVTIHNGLIDETTTDSMTSVLTNSMNGSPLQHELREEERFERR